MLLALAALLAAAAAHSEPPVVTAVELRSEVPLERSEELLELIAVVPGQSLDRAAVARSLRNLHAYGAGGEIAAFTREEGDGVAVVFGIWARYEVDEVRIEGDYGVKRYQLRRLLLQREAQPLNESKVIRGVYRLQDFYRTSGYPEAVVRLAVTLDEPRKRARVAYQVDAGPRARIREVEFTGRLGPFTADQLRQPLRSEPGRHHHQQGAASDGERLQDWLIRQGYRQAVVDPPEESYDPDSDTVDLLYAVDVGPRFRLEASEVPVDRLKRKGLLPFLQTERYDESLLEQARDALVAHYQRQGHYDVAVELAAEESDDEVVLRLAIEPGPTYRLASVAFRGNEAVGSEQLAALMATNAGGRLLGGGGRLVDESLAADLSNIRSYYVLQGYGEVVVGPAEVEKRERKLALVVPIAEGPRRRVVGLELVGAERLDRETLLEGLALRPAGPYHARLLEESLAQIRARYEAAGMLAAQVNADVSWNDDRSLADVTIKVFEGPRNVVDRVIVRGHQRVRPSVVRRAVRLEAEEAVSTGRLLEAQRRLYDLGVFSRVGVELAPGTPFSEERDVLVRVEEGQHRRVTYGVGYDSEDGARGLLGVGHRNLFGRAVSGRFDVRVSQRESQIRALVRQPSLGRLRWPVSYSLFRIEESRDSFDSKRRGVQVEAQRLRRGDRYGLQLSYRLVEVEKLEAALVDLAIDRELREVEIVSLAPSLLFDRRDDPLDPRRGWSTNLIAEYAFRGFGAETSFLKLFGQQTAHLDLRAFGTVAASLRVGTIEPLDSGNAVDPTVPSGLLSARIPISERFFAGGRTTHRAYRRDRLGVPGQTLVPFVDPGGTSPLPRLVPIGGAAQLLANLDYRFPVAGPVGGVVFVDVGNVWADWRSIDPAEAKAGAGLGVRYLSPIGPVRLEIGWKLDREPGEDSFVVSFSVGNPF